MYHLNMTVLTLWPLCIVFQRYVLTLQHYKSCPNCSQSEAPMLVMQITTLPQFT